MKYHTFVCGSSKSKKEDAYYIYHNDRFWGTLREVGITHSQIDPSDYRRLGREYGIYLTEIVDPAEYRVAQDSDIEPYHVEEGIESLIERIEAYDPKRIAFVGKNAATWFYRYIEDKEITHSQASGHKSDRRNLQELELDWSFLGLDYYLLSNTHRHWDKDVWTDFWKICKDDVDQFH
ncbi:uracil-DNA glycosylase family protein [Haloarculaceae archaeon H-GB11]|nr:uracil-DNA glycosylase family protein [Haloarculaceae archaeon H-GB1-1]MEA5388323.1 uracil-DNA glycosylase family protein [Haloarculaceae archaeon H-GB11]